MGLSTGGASLLLHGDGVDGSTVFTDASGKAVTPSGNAQISTAQSKFGGSSMLFDGAGDYLTVSPNTDFDLTNRDFTIEAWVRFSAFPTASNGQYVSAILSKDTSGARSYEFDCTGTSTSLTTVRFVSFVGGGVSVVSGSFSFSLATWYHVAVSRTSGLVYLFVDGTLLNAGGTAVGSIDTTSSVVRVGACPYGGGYDFYLNAYIDDLRFVLGTGVYTADFTPPTTPLDLINPITIAVQPHSVGNFNAGNYNPALGEPKDVLLATTLSDSAPYGLPNSLTPGYASQFEFKGRGRITGTVAEKALPANTPLRRKVMLHRLPEGSFVRATWSDATSGEYIFAGVRPDCRYTVTSYDHTGTYRAVIADNLAPDPL